MPVSTSLTPCTPAFNSAPRLAQLEVLPLIGLLSPDIGSPPLSQTVDEHAGRSLVSYLHHIGPRASCDQLRDGVLRVVVNRACKIGNRRVALPGHRNALLARIGPVVAVVKVDQKAHAGIFHLFAKCDSVDDVIVAIGLVIAIGGLGIDEGSQADEIEPVRLQDGQEIGPGGVWSNLLVRHIGADEI